MYADRSMYITILLVVLVLKCLLSEYDDGESKLHHCFSFGSLHITSPLLKAYEEAMCIKVIIALNGFNAMTCCSNEMMPLVLVTVRCHRLRSSY